MISTIFGMWTLSGQLLEDMHLTQIINVEKTIDFTCNKFDQPSYLFKDNVQ